MLALHVSQIPLAQLGPRVREPSAAKSPLRQLHRVCLRSRYVLYWATMWHVFDRARDRVTALLLEASLLALISKCSLLLVFCLFVSFILPQACSTDAGRWLPSVRALKTFDFISLQHSSNERPAVLITSAADKVRRATTTATIDFATFADAVAAVDDLVRVPTAALETAVAELVRQQLSYAVQELFPFMSAQHIQGFTNLQHRRRESKGLVIPCGNTDFEAGVHLIVAGIRRFACGGPFQLLQLSTCIQTMSV